jgi:hypothetical protein
VPDDNAMRSSCSLLLCLVAGCAGAPPVDPATPHYQLVAQPDGGVQARRDADALAILSPPGAVFVTNRSTVSFPWRLEASEPWLCCTGAQSGVLTPSGSVRIEPAIDGAHAPTTPGWHEAELRVLNAMTFYCEARIPVRWIVDGSGHSEPSIGAAPGAGLGVREPGQAALQAREQQLRGER